MLIESYTIKVLAFEIQLFHYTEGWSVFSTEFTDTFDIDCTINFETKELCLAYAQKKIKKGLVLLKHFVHQEPESVFTERPGVEHFVYTKQCWNPSKQKELINVEDSNSN